MRTKKVLAIVLAMAMLVGVVSVASAATSLAPVGFADSQDSKHAEAIAYLKAANILRGDAGTNNMRPNDALTREEFVAIVVRATGYETLANGLAGFKPNFTDADQISDWAVGAVNFATGQGWIKGYEDGTFRPKGNLTMAEAITVWVRATGHELLVPSTSVWPIGHIIAANQAGISSGLSVNASAAITRADMARMTFNSLFVATAYLDNDNKVKTDGSMLAEATARIVQGNVDAVRPGINEIDIDGDTYDMADSVTLLGGNTLAGLVGLEVRVTINVDNEVYIIHALGGASGAHVFKSLTGSAGAYTGMTMEDGTSFKVDTLTTANVNGKAVPMATSNDVQNFLEDMVAGDDVVATVEGGTAVHLEVTRLHANNYIVYGHKIDQAANATSDALYVFHNEALHGNAGPEPEFEVPDAANDNIANLVVPRSTQVYLNGERASLGDLKRYDVLRMALEDSETPGDGKKVLKIVATRDTLAGTITSKVAKLGSNGRYTAHVTVKLSDGTERTVTWHRTDVNPNVVLGFVDNPDDPVSYLINSSNQAVRDIGYVELEENVKVVAIWSTASGTYVDVDIDGQQRTFADPGAVVLATDINRLGYLVYDALGIVSFTQATPFGGDNDVGTIQSILEGNIVIYKVGNQTRVVASPIVYKANANFNGPAEYLGATALEVGDEIKVSDNLWIIVKK